MLPKKIKLVLNNYELDQLHKFIQNACALRPKSSNYDLKLLMALADEVRKKTLKLILEPREQYKLQLTPAQALAIHQLYLKDTVQDDYSLDFKILCGELNKALT